MTMSITTNYRRRVSPYEEDHQSEWNIVTYLHLRQPSCDILAPAPSASSRLDGRNKADHLFTGDQDVVLSNERGHSAD